MIDWLIDAFDSKKYPWFRDDFIHPSELAKEYRGPPLVNLLEGFAGLARDQRDSANAPRMRTGTSG
jgi:hypothetical protein